MSEQETSLPVSDAALFEAATAESETAPQDVTSPNDAAVPEGQTPKESPRAEPTEARTSRDPRGRFASRAKDADAAPTQQPPQTQDQPPDAPSHEHQDAQIPSWRARELREQRVAAERRANDIQRNYQALERQFHAMAAQLHELTHKGNGEPDLFVDPDAFIRTKVEPVRQQVGAELGQMPRASRG